MLKNCSLGDGSWQDNSSITASAVKGQPKVMHTAVQKLSLWPKLSLQALCVCIHHTASLCVSWHNCKAQKSLLQGQQSMCGQEKGRGRAPGHLRDAGEKEWAVSQGKALLQVVPTYSKYNSLTKYAVVFQGPYKLMSQEIISYYRYQLTFKKKKKLEFNLF